MKAYCFYQAKKQRPLSIDLHGIPGDEFPHITVSSSMVAEITGKPFISYQPFVRKYVKHKQKEPFF